MDAVRIGCSGWVYDHWRGPFYPPEVKAKDRLAFYATRFSTTEINASFYHLPSEAAVRGWAETAPPGFLFAWKVSRFISHFRKLKDCEESVELVFGRMAGLGEHAGPALLQLPPNLHRNDERLDGFLALLKGRGACAVEFRHPSWYEPAVFEILAAHGAALCISDHHHAPAPWTLTSRLAYVRGHGPGGRYFGNYSDEELAQWAARLAEWRREGREVFCYFDNDVKSAAPADALRLIAALEAPADR
jgi:uncharacterized protein YecE (DUF72 family)